MDAPSSLGSAAGSCLPAVGPSLLGFWIKWEAKAFERLTEMSAVAISFFFVLQQ